MTAAQTNTWAIRGAGTPAQWLFVRLLLGSYFNHQLYIDMPSDPVSAPAYLGPEAVSDYSDLVGAPGTWLPACQGELIHGLWLRQPDNVRLAMGFGHYGASLAGVSFAQLAGAIASRTPKIDWSLYSLAAQLHSHGGQIQPSTNPNTIDSTLRPGARVCARRFTQRLAGECVAIGARLGASSEAGDADFVIELAGGGGSDHYGAWELEAHPDGAITRSGDHTANAPARSTTAVPAAHFTTAGWMLPLSEQGGANLWFSDSDCAALLATMLRAYGAARFDGAAWRSACARQISEVQANITQVDTLLRAAAAKAAGSPPEGATEQELELLLRGRPDLPHLISHDLSPLTILALTLAGPPRHPDPIAASLPPDLVARHLAKIAQAVRQRLTASKSL